MMIKKTAKKKVTAKKESKAKKPAVRMAKAKPEVKKLKGKAAPEPRAKVKKIIAAKAKPAEKKAKLAVAPALPVKPAVKFIPTAPAKEIPRPPFREAPKAVIAKEPVVPQKPAATVPVKEAPKPAATVPVKEAPKPAVPPTAPEEIKPAPQPLLKEIELELPITVKDLAVRLQEKSSVIIKILMGLGEMIGINQPLSETQAEKICLKYGCKIKRAPEKEDVILGIHREQDKPQDLKHRSPVVTFMGHVDHGKTSLLDAIRKTKVAESEHGGITQHIGAYRVVLPGGEITFLDTPGHEAFTAMRARGARITDIVVLVVAADDGVMPQTQEAIDHARAAEVPIIVAMNKIDRQQANADRVKKQLSELGLVAEDWGGKTITVPVSAKTGQGIDNLLEMILLEAQMLELKSNPHRLARGVVIEAKMAKGRGPVVTLLVENGTLRLNENIIVGNFYGKIRAMFNDRGASVVSAGPSEPVEVLGISGIPEAGEQFFAIAEEKEAKELAQARMEKERQAQVKEVKRVSLEDLHAQILAGKIKDLKLIIKADVQGSLEAIKNTLEKLNVSEIKLNIIHTGVGNINNSDAVLAMASDALILGFNVACDDLAKETADKEGLDVRIYNIIYELANDIKAAVEGMLEPKIKKVFLGKAEVRKVFKLSRSGIVAGCFVTKGKFNRAAVVNLVRNGEVVFEGKLASLKRFKDDVREVAEGFECGMAIAGFDQLMEGDVIEGYEIEKIARKL